MVALVVARDIFSFLSYGCNKEMFSSQLLAHLVSVRLGGDEGSASAVMGTFFTYIALLIARSKFVDFFIHFGISILMNSFQANELVMKELYLFGPLSMAMPVTSEFLHYSHGMSVKNALP